MKPFGDIAHYYRNSSTNVAPLFADLSMDFIYVDARHDYCGVMEDIIAWYPKLKIGGVMAGHDFLTAREARSHSNGRENWIYCSNGTINDGACKRAVVDFACKHQIAVFHTKDRPPSWYFSRKAKQIIP